MEGREDGALEGICSKPKDLVREESQLSKKRPGSLPGAPLKSKMPRTVDDGEGPEISSISLGKRGGITLGDAGEGSSSNAKKLKTGLDVSKCVRGFRRGRCQPQLVEEQGTGVQVLPRRIPTR